MGRWFDDPRPKILKRHRGGTAWYVELSRSHTHEEAQKELIEHAKVETRFKELVIGIIAVGHWACYGVEYDFTDPKGRV